MADRSQITPRMAERRGHILNAAIACIVRKGFHKTSMRDISSAAAVSLGNLYNHFKSKDVLISAIATLEASELADLKQELLDIDHPSKALHRIADHQLQQINSQSDAVLALEIAAEAGRNKDIARAFQTNRHELAGLIESYITQGLANGHFRTPLPASHLAELLIDLIEGLAVRPALRRSAVSQDERKALHDALDALLMPNEEVDHV